MKKAPSFDPVEDGFETVAGSPYLELLAPIWRRDESLPIFALRVEGQHTNFAGTAHGGVLMSFAEMVLGRGIRSCFARPIDLVAASLTVDFVRPVAVGSRIVASADIQYRSERTAFANCFMTCAGERVAHASGVFTVLAQH